MKLYTVGVLGATGAVGQEMMNLLEERNFPVGKLVPLASKRSAGKTLKFRGEDVVIREACEVYHFNPDAWNKLMIRGMESDFSWKTSAEKYVEVYSSI